MESVLPRVLTPWIALLCALAWTPGASSAQLRLGGSVALTSDYVYRGISQTRNEAALQADLHASVGDSWLVGLWASQVRLLPSSRTTELNYYAQWRRPVGSQFSAAVGAVYYAFPADPRSVPYDYGELTAELTWRDRVTLTVDWVPKVTLFSFGYGRAFDRETRSVELTANQRLPLRLELQGGVGYFEAVGLPNSAYLYGSMGVSRAFGRWRVDLSYYAAQDATRRIYIPGRAGGPWAATLSRYF
jgi:uncharacterized protein (TIGR02001 family)